MSDETETMSGTAADGTSEDAAFSPGTPAPKGGPHAVVSNKWGTITRWVSDASFRHPRGAEHADDTTIIQIAVMPLDDSGKPRKSEGAVIFTQGHPNVAGAELLGVLSAHVLARSAGEQAPVVCTDARDAPQILKRIKDGKTPNVPPKVLALAEAMGRSELNRVRFCWHPRNTTPGLKTADRLSKTTTFKRRGQTRVKPSEVIGLAENLALLREFPDLHDDSYYTLPLPQQQEALKRYRGPQGAFERKLLRTDLPFLFKVDSLQDFSRWSLRSRVDLSDPAKLDEAFAKLEKEFARLREVWTEGEEAFVTLTDPRPKLWHIIPRTDRKPYVTLVGGRLSSGRQVPATSHRQLRISAAGRTVSLHEVTRTGSPGRDPMCVIYQVREGSRVLGGLEAYRRPMPPNGRPASRPVWRYRTRGGKWAKGVPTRREALELLLTGAGE